MTQENGPKQHRRRQRRRHGQNAGGGEGRCLCLNDLPPGSHCRIRTVGGGREIRRRLMDLGIAPDAHTVVVRSAPLDDPIQLRLGDDNVSIRRAEAALVEVEDAAVQTAEGKDDA